MNASHTARRVRVLAYSHDGYGLGHLRRNLRIVSGLRRRRTDVEALLITGAKGADRLASRFGVQSAQLPPVVKVANGRYAGDHSTSSFADIVHKRSFMIAAAVRDFKPDLLLVDRYPLGMRGELEPALQLHATQRPGAPAVLGLRDILDSPATIHEEWRQQGHSEAIREWYGTVLCYGDPDVYNPISEYRLPPDIAGRIRFTGYLADDVEAADALNVRASSAANHERLVVCTLGGGRDAAHIADTFLSAMLLLRASGWSGVLVTGPYMSPTDVGQLRRHPAAGWIPVIEMVDDVPSYLAAADVAVCMGGYNTSCELLGVGVPAVTIPRIRPRQEQLMRTERMATRGLVELLHPSDLTADVLARRVEHAGALSRAEMAGRLGDIKRHGVAAATSHLEALLPPAIAGADRGIRERPGAEEAAVAS